LIRGSFLTDGGANEVFISSPWPSKWKGGGREGWRRCRRFHLFEAALSFLFSKPPFTLNHHNTLFSLAPTKNHPIHPRSFNAFFPSALAHSPSNQANTTLAFRHPSLPLGSTLDLLLPSPSHFAFRPSLSLSSLAHLSTRTHSLDPSNDFTSLHLPQAGMSYYERSVEALDSFGQGLLSPPPSVDSAVEGEDEEYDLISLRSESSIQPNSSL